ncbi:bifunctional isocitrate dehydrogenase kinase/phosphatase [Pseudomonas aeruginosa]|nr:bifunctional isocitrate dehydrogenase kinase/phosphatase [Pseudomonas aeruginosa]
MPASSRRSGRKRSAPRRSGSTSRGKGRRDGGRLRAGLADSELLDVERWPIIKSAYIAQIKLRLDDELAETWFNSIFCGCSPRQHLATARCSCTPPGPRCAPTPARPTPGTYRPGGDLLRAGEDLRDYRLDVPYDDRERDLERIDALLDSNLPDWVQDRTWPTS